jgi:hypothetical protein
MSIILEGVLRMPPDCWGDSPLDVMQRHARYVEAADTIDTLREQLEAARKLLRRISEWDQMNPPMTGDHAHWKREIDAAIAASGSKP